MARTAPVPNIPPIPGMCPSIAVMGGGGGSGGSGGNGAGNGNGNGPGGGNGSGDAADGEGQGAGSCGQGSSTGCPQHANRPAAGDPVAVLTGRVFTRPITDLHLPGPLPFVWSRSYSSSARHQDVGLGFGWSHSFAWCIEETRSELRITGPDGRFTAFQADFDEGEAVQSVAGWTLSAVPGGFVLDANDALLRTFVPADRGGFRLAAVKDRFGNQIRLHYSADRLVEVVDSTGRVVRIATDTAGRVLELAINNQQHQGRWVQMVGYQYTNTGDLEAVRDADGMGPEYAYLEHRLVRARAAAGYVSHWQYDAGGRCTDTWGDFDGTVDASLDEDVPDLLADGVTKARGVHHVHISFDGTDVEVVDSIEVKRFQSDGFGNATKAVALGGGVTSRRFDPYGNVMSLTDPLGQVEHFQHDERGQLLSHSFGDASTRLFRRNERGAMIGYSDASGATWQFDRDGRDAIVAMVDPEGARRSFERDTQGRIVREHLPNGGKRSFTYDDAGNLIRCVEPNGGVWAFAWDFAGRCIAVTGPRGSTCRTVLSDAGRMRLLRDEDGSTTHLSYDSEHRISQLQAPTGAQWSWVYGGYNQLVELKQPDGTSIRYRYNREGWLTSVINEDGRAHRFEHERNASARSEASFDGAVTKYKYDKLGRVTRVITPTRQTIDSEYDADGNVVLRSYQDGTADAFTYDRCGRMISMKSPEAQFSFERDARGRLIRETVRRGDDVTTIEHAYDTMGRLVEARSSLGFHQRIVRNASGGRVRVEMDGAVVDHVRDEMNSEVTRLLPDGGALHWDFDAVGAVRRTEARSPNASTVELQYGYLDGLLTDRSDRGVSSATYSYDSMRRLRERVTRLGQERLSVDARGNPVHEGTPATFGPRNQLERSGGTSYGYDAAGRLVTKEASGQRWEYTWTRRGHLGSVRRPDGALVSFKYDPAGRLLSKRVTVSGRTTSETRYVWSGDVLVHELRSRAAAAGDPIVEERTYCWEDAGLVPWAERRRTRGADPGAWTFYLLDPGGRPAAIVDATGKVLARPSFDMFGKGERDADATPFRSPGQLADEDTGLHYNRHRFFDPEVGRYISPDPIGMHAGEHEYRFGRDNVLFADPFGLHGATATLTDPGGGAARPVVNTQPHPGAPNTRFDSGYLGNEQDDFLAPGGQLRPGVDSGTAYLQSHSEQRILRQIHANPGSGEPDPNLAGRTLTITGDQRSCVNCARAIQAFARTNRMRVEYHTADHEPLVVDHREGHPQSDNTRAYNRRTRRLERDATAGRVSQMSADDRAAHRARLDAAAQASQRRRANESPAEAEERRRRRRERDQRNREEDANG